MAKFILGAIRTTAFLKTLFLVGFVAACSPAELPQPNPRQNALVIYEGPTEFVRLQTPAAQRVIAPCRDQFEETLASWANPTSGYALHFGVMYGVHDSNGCTFFSDGDAGSVAEISPLVQRACEALHLQYTGNKATCTPVAIARPRGVTRAEPGAVGKRQGDELLSELARYESGYGAMATASDGRWSVYVRETREAADQVAMSRCRALHGLGLERFSDELRKAVQDSCAIIYRFGPDYPGAENVRTIRP